MQEGRGEAYLREMAKECRLLADQLHNESAAASLRKLAEDYEQAAEAAPTDAFRRHVPAA
jgi:hypothetical protein